MKTRNESLEFSIVSSETSSQFKEPDLSAPLSVDREAYKNDESCINCTRKFNIPGLSMSKKLICLFCYHGVCQLCLIHEYFHSETKQVEKMCSPCHHQLSFQAKNFYSQLNSYRLERAGLWKDISLASKQKEIFIKQRQIAADELKSIKTSIDLLNLGKNKELDEEKLKNLELENKFHKTSESIQELNTKISFFQEKFKKLKEENEDFKQNIEKKNFVNQKISEEIKEFKLKNSILAQIQAEEVFDEGEVEEKIMSLNEEISGIMEKLNEKRGLIEEVEIVLREIVVKIEENDLNLELISQKIIEFKSNNNNLTEKEKEILENLKFQIKQQDDLIAISQARSQQSKLSDRGSVRRIDTFGRYHISSELQPSNVSSAGFGGEKAQRKCQSCVLI